MKKVFITAAALLLSVALTLTMTVTAFAAGENGLSVSKNVLEPGEKFTVSICIPASGNADTASIKAEFDQNAFEVITWAPALANSVSNYGSDFFIVTSANAERSIDLSKGVTLRAELAVKKTAPTGNYIIKLTQHSLSYVNDNGYDYTELWDPTTTEAAVRVEQSQSNTTTNDSTANSTDSSANSTGSITVTSSMTGIANRSIRVSVPKGVLQNMDIKLSNTNEAAEYAARALDKLGLSDRRSYSFDISITDTTTRAQIHSIQSGYIDFVFPIPDNLAASGRLFELYHIDGGIPQRIDSATSTENGIRVIKFRASTFSPYMIVDVTEDTAGFSSSPESDGIAAADDEIVINDDPDDPEVETPLNSDDPDDPDDPEDTEVTVPAGNNTTNNNGDSGSADVTIINDNTGKTDNANNAGTGGTPIRPSNPHTGVAVAITVPAVLVGCVLLSRKVTSKRKRAKKYIEP